MPIRANTR
ncbi:hypothetical protein YPPY32_2405, partial [Yersinia pestis PY-32]